MKTAEDALRAFARETGSRVTECDSFDANVGETFRFEVRIESPQRARLQASPSFVCVQLPVDTLAGAFSVNRIDRITGLKDKVRKRDVGIPWRVYVDAKRLPAVVKEWLHSASPRRLIGDLHLAKQESLHVYGNAVVFYAKPTRSFFRLIQGLAELAAGLPSEVLAPPGDTPSVPIPLEFDLLFREFEFAAICDDVERSDVLGNLERGERERLVATIRPMLNRIDEYLSSFGDDPLPEPAVRLSCLAEAAAELVAEET